MGGIGSVRSKIVTATGQRLMKVLETDNNKKVRTALLKHRFVLDGQGQVTSTPDDTPGIADICDSLRYLGQNMFPISGPKKPELVLFGAGDSLPDNQKFTPEQHNVMAQELAKAIGTTANRGGNGGRGGFRFTF